MSTAIYDEYRTLLERRRRSPKTINNFDVAVYRFVEWCDERNINASDPDPVLVEDYFLTLPVADSTRAQHLTQIRAAFRYALRRGAVRRDPTVDVILPRVADSTVRTIPYRFLKTAQENCADDAQLLLFRMAAYTGARAFEIRKMTWDDIDLPNRTIEIIGKGGKRRLVPVHPALGDVLSQGTGTGLVFPGHRGQEPHHATMDDRLKKIIPTYTFHDFRRTVASSLDANGVSEGEIAEIMGWAPKTVFQRHYRRVAPERLHKAILRLYADDPL